MIRPRSRPPTSPLGDLRRSLLVWLRQAQEMQDRLPPTAPDRQRRAVERLVGLILRLQQATAAAERAWGRHGRRIETALRAELSRLHDTWLDASQDAARRA